MSGYQAFMKHQIPAIRLSRVNNSRPSQQAVSKEAAKKSTKPSEKHVARQEENSDIPSVVKKLKLDLDKPLRHALEQVFNHQGTVVLTFQGSSYDQVSEYADNIMSSYKPPRVTRSMKCHFTDCTLDTTDSVEEIKVEVVEVLISNIPSYKRKLKEEFGKFCLIPKITVVSLKTTLPPTSYVVGAVTGGGQQVLTIDTQGRPVFFKDYNPAVPLDDTSVFLKVEYQPSGSSPMKIIWINLNTLLPIRYIESENQFFADLPETSLQPTTPITGGGDDPPTDKPSGQTSTDDPDDGNIPHALSDPFYYIPKIIDKDDFNYHVHGDEEEAIIYPVLGGSPDKRISKGDGNKPPAILATSDLKFHIITYPIGGDVNN